MNNKEAFEKTATSEKKLHTGEDNTNMVYDIVGEIVSKTNLTRRSVVKILQTLHADKFKLLSKNPEEFIAKCSELINEVKATLIIAEITYHKTTQRHDAKTVFMNNKPALRRKTLLTKHVYDYLITDSNIETKFADALEKSTEVSVYAKLPRKFQITTPIANYSPDWAIVFHEDKVTNIYFVAETKGSDLDVELRKTEEYKLKCATEHFKAISGGEVAFHTISSYEKLLEFVKVK